jgi:PAS domain-containing protein
MRRECAWCRQSLNDVEQADESNRPVTHGICTRCAQLLLARYPESLGSFLDRLPVPILVIDDAPRVFTANEAARLLLGKDLPAIEGRRGGDVIECVHAGAPGGCGEQVHCKSCTIRNTVLETFQTGDGFRRVKAYPDIQVGQSVKTFTVEITTEKVGDFVLLQVDEFSEAAPSIGQE